MFPGHAIRVGLSAPAEPCTSVNQEVAAAECEQEGGEGEGGVYIVAKRDLMGARELLLGGDDIALG